MWENLLDYFVLSYFLSFLKREQNLGHYDRWALPVVWENVRPSARESIVFCRVLLSCRSISRRRVLGESTDRLTHALLQFSVLFPLFFFPYVSNICIKGRISVRREGPSVQVELDFKFSSYLAINIRCQLYWWIDSSRKFQSNMPSKCIPSICETPTDWRPGTSSAEIYFDKRDRGRPIDCVAKPKWKTIEQMIGKDFGWQSFFIICLWFVSILDWISIQSLNGWRCLDESDLKGTTGHKSSINIWRDPPRGCNICGTISSYWADVRKDLARYIKT